MITATFRIRTSAGKNSEVVRLLRSMIGPTSVETGCIGCRLYQEIDDPDSIIWVEEWQSMDKLKCHLRSKQYLKMLTALDMSDVRPEIRFDTTVETDGMRVIQEARGADTTS